MHPRYRAIARVEKTHGKRGEVVTVSVHGLPPLLREGLETFVVPPALKGPRMRRVLSADEGRSGQLVSLEGVGDIDSASRLVGKLLLARVGDLPEGYALHDADALVGRPVRDVRWGRLGSVVELMRGPANDVWVIDGGPHGEVLLPVVDSVVSELPPEGEILVDAPEGLLGEVGN